MNHLTPIGLLLVIMLLCPSPSFSAKKVTKTSHLGELVFKQSCASCHAGGGNTVNPQKPVCASDKLATLGVFKEYLKAPLGHMPYYKHVVSDEKILASLYEYCKGLKKQPSKQALLFPEQSSAF